MQNVNSSTSLDILLPKEMWSTVFAHLPANELRKMELISSLFLAALKAYLNHASIPLCNMGFVSGPSAVQYAMARQLPFVILESCTDVADELITKLSKCLHLRELNLEGSNVSNVACLAQLTNLQYLNLYETQVSNVACLALLTNLQELNLCKTQVSDVACLAQLTNLQCLDLYKTQVSDVACLGQLANLLCLNLCETQVSDIACLALLTNLRELNVYDTQVSDAAFLTQLTDLQ